MAQSESPRPPPTAPPPPVPPTKPTKPTPESINDAPSNVQKSELDKLREQAKADSRRLQEQDELVGDLRDQIQLKQSLLQHMDDQQRINDDTQTQLRRHIDDKDRQIASLRSELASLRKERKEEEVDISAAVSWPLRSSIVAASPSPLSSPRPMVTMDDNDDCSVNFESMALKATLLVTNAGHAACNGTYVVDGTAAESHRPIKWVCKETGAWLEWWSESCGWEMYHANGGMCKYWTAKTKRDSWPWKLHGAKWIVRRGNQNIEPPPSISAKCMFGDEKEQALLARFLCQVLVIPKQIAMLPWLYREVDL